MNLRPSGYEPDELPGCSTPRQAMIFDHCLEGAGTFRRNVRHVSNPPALARQRFTWALRALPLAGRAAFAFRFRFFDPVARPVSLKPKRASLSRPAAEALGDFDDGLHGVRPRMFFCLPNVYFSVFVFHIRAALKIWRRLTLPRLETQYHQR